MRYAFIAMVACAAPTAAQSGGPARSLDLFVPALNGVRADSTLRELGRRLFFDRRLSRDSSLACASCHMPERAFTDGRAQARGVGGVLGPRNTPTLLNRGYGLRFSWDGGASTLREQVLRPIANPRELDADVYDVARRIGIDVPTLASALTMFVATLFSPNTPFDDYLAGDTSALSAEARFGRSLFLTRAGCVNCHVGPNLSDELFHNTGIAWRSGAPVDSGRHQVTKLPRDVGSFKTPTLREVSRTAPYMHDGSIGTLADVIDHYDRGGIANPLLDSELQPLGLNPAEKAALVAFLQSLSARSR